MRHFLSVAGIVAGNFVLWTLITFLPVHSMIMFCLAIAVGCLMIYALVRFGIAADSDPSAKG
jgi:putative flippase GtrA